MKNNVAILKVFGSIALIGMKMALKCFKCFRTFAVISKLFQHLRLWHFHGSRGITILKCCNKKCVSIFRTFSGYKKHLLKCVLKPTILQSNKNINTIDLNNINKDTTLASDNTAKTNITYNESEILDTPEPKLFSSTEPRENLETCMSAVNIQIVSFISSLMALDIPLSTIVSIVENVDELISLMFEKIRLFLPQGDREECNNFFNAVISSIEKFNSTYKIKKTFSENIVKPVEIAVGVRTDQVFHKISNTYLEKNVTDTFAYIPILDTLTALLKNKHIQKYFTTDFISLSKSNHLESIYDSEYYQNSTFFQENPNAIQIQLYFDEFECTAPLGSKTGIHKIGAIYFIIRNIPSKYLGQLDNINLAACFCSSDLKKYSINTFLKPIITDLQVLENDGIAVSFLPQHLKGTLVALSFDNLGGNTLSGMVESFSANYFCRMCLMHKNDTQNVFKESDERCHLRNEDFFNSLPEILPNSSYYGIKQQSILNDLKYFNLGNIYAVDIMHDILEGVAQLEIKLIITYLVSEKILSLREINQRIFSFNYGSIDQCTKPSPVNIEKLGSSIGERAAQTWTLVRYLPLMLIDVIPKCGERWNILSLLLEIMNICFAPIIPVKMTYVLENLIFKHHSLVKKYNGKIIPKHHIMIHYPNAIRKMGPLIYLWSMRFEAKHGYFKNLINKLRNFKNIPQTLCMRHQINQFIKNENLYKMSINVGPLNIFDLNDYAFKDIITNELDIPNSVKVHETKHLKYGFLYKPSFFICVNKNNRLPIFQEIIKIILLDEHPFFITKSWDTMEFVTNLNAFLVVPGNDISICDLKLLIYKEPYEYKTVSNSFYIVPKYIFV